MRRGAHVHSFDFARFLNIGCRLALAFYSIGILDLLGILDDGTYPVRWERAGWIKWLWAQQTRMWLNFFPIDAR